MNRTHGGDIPFPREKEAKPGGRELREGRPAGLPMGRTMYSAPKLLGLSSPLLGMSFGPAWEKRESEAPILSQGHGNTAGV